MPSSKIEKLYDKKLKTEGKTPEDQDEFIRIARERSNDAETFWSDTWKEAEADLTFLAGEQWPSGVKTERENANRPCLTNNVLPTFVDQVIGDQRQNKPAIKVNPVDMVRVPNDDGGENEELKISSLAGNQDYTLAETLGGLIKNIEYMSDAESAYDIAFQGSLQSSIGYLRVMNDYMLDDSFEQDLMIKAIQNQFSVRLDPNAKEYDFSDAMWCFIDDTMPKADFQAAYPGKTSEPIAGSASSQGSWFTDKTVRVSEYFVREPEIKEKALMSDGASYYLDEIEPIVDELAAKGVSIVRTRKVKTYKVKWYKITGTEILEGPIELNFSSIPVIPVFGKSIQIKDKKKYISLIRYSKDAQRQANYWDSAATESISLAPKAPFIGAEGHTEGYEDDWDNANTENQSMLRYVPQYQGDPGPRREQPSPVPAAQLTMAGQSTDKIKATLGMFDASIGAMGNETSGKAIIARQRQGDRGSFTFIDNLSKAIRRVGKLLVEAIPKVYDTERVVRIKFPDETEDFVKLNEQIFDEQTGEWVTINDLGVAKYDVVVKTGPSYSTQRIEAAEAMIQFAQAVPSAAAVMSDLIALNMDWLGADTIAERLKKIVPPNVLTNDERKQLEEDMPPPPPPTPEQQVQMAEIEVRKLEAEGNGAKAQAEIEKAQATIAKAQSDVAQAQADTIQAEMETKEAQLKLAEIEAGANLGNIAYQQVKELVAQALAEAMSQGNNQVTTG